MRGTSFRGANLCGADLSSSQLRDADFRGFAAPGNATNLFRADLHSSGCSGTQFNARTLFCQTTTCNGTISNRDCPAGTAPADVCCLDADCGAGHACRNGTCCATDPKVAVDAADPGATIRLCAGNYRTVDLVIRKNLTIVGAGSGGDPATATILDAQGAGRVLETATGASVTIRDLAVTGGVFAASGAGILNQGDLTLTGVAVRGNVAGVDGGGVYNLSVLTLQTGSRVENNRAGGAGGGIFRSAGTVTLDPGSVVTNNTPDNCEPAIGTCT